MEIKNYKDKNLENILEKIIPEFNPKKVILFGSRANGSHSEHSDYDLFIILNDSNTNSLERAQKANQLTWKLGHSIDFFIYTEKEYFEYKDEINTIANIAKAVNHEMKNRSSKNIEIS